MITESAAVNKPPLSLGAKLFISVVTLASAPGYITVLILIYGYIEELIVGRYYSSPSYIRRSDMLKMAITVLSLLGVLTHLVALLMASIGSFSGMSRRAKVIGWWVALGGILGLAFAYQVIWTPYIRQ